jgi:carboxypeptidase PM20D1
MKLLKWMLAALVLLIAVMALKTAMFTKQDVTLLAPLDDSSLDKQALAERLSKAIQFKTISHMRPEDNDPQVFRDFHTYLKASFPALHQELSLEMVNELSLLYLWKGSDSSLKPMLIMSHQDVVPVDSETLDRWSHAPFGGEISDGIIWGRGAIDIKSGVLGSMEAVENLIKRGFKPKRSLYLAFGHDEEIGGVKGAKKIATLLKDRDIELEFVLDEGGSIVGGGIIPGVENPIALVGIAEKGYVSLKMTLKAVGGHSSMPPKHSALGTIAQALVDLENQPFPANLDYSKIMFDNIGPAMSGVKRVVFANMWITQPIVESILSGSKTTNASIRTTTAVTMAKGSSKDNILPSEASAVVNFRIMPGETVKSVTEYVATVINNPSIVITPLKGFGNNPSSVSVSDNQNFELIKNSIYRVTQNKDLIVTPYLVMAGTDAKHYSGLSDSIYRFAFNRLEPDTLDRVHGINEQIKVNDYVDMVRFFRELIVGANL